MPYHMIRYHATIPYQTIAWYTLPDFIIPCHVAPTIRYHTIDAGERPDGGYLQWLGLCKGFERAGITLTTLHVRALKALHFWVNDGTHVCYLPPATHYCPLPTTTLYLLLPATYYYCVLRRHCHTQAHLVAPSSRRRYRSSTDSAIGTRLATSQLGFVVNIPPPS